MDAFVNFCFCNKSCLLIPTTGWRPLGCRLININNLTDDVGAALKMAASMWPY